MIWNIFSFFQDYFPVVQVLCEVAFPDNYIKNTNSTPKEKNKYGQQKENIENLKRKL